MALTDAGGTTVATYSYETFGTPTSWESFTNGWHNPFRYDGRDGARYDGETGLYWLSVRAYDPTLGRFLSRDPLGRVPLFFDASQPYAYGGNNPINNVDPSGQMFRGAFNGEGVVARRAPYRPVTRISTDPCANPQSARCRQIKLDSWRLHAMEARKNHLSGLLKKGSILMVVGLFAASILDFSALIFQRMLYASVVAGIDLALNLVSVLAYLPAAFGLGAGWANVFAKLSASLMIFAAIGRAVLGGLNAAKDNFIEEKVLEATWFTARKGSGGLIGTILQIVWMLAGPVINNFLSAGAKALQASGLEMIANYNAEMSLNIDYWCSLRANRGVWPKQSDFGL